MKVKLLLIFALTLTMPLLMAPKTRANGVPGDIDGDGKVTVLDVAMAGSQYLLTPDDPEYNASIVEKADFVNDDIINILDLTTLIYYYTG